ncbi:Regulatory protein, LuxR:Response regulator receiver [Candidatus Methylopumilus planktonicus]|uniref:Regulatory protein, LuxR:Response regulator receiver n=2 Tax=Candidatus Methylopumilus planktonicus TaxID=1581557 RepID=A0A0D6EV22_9PROT|nr:response regulator transcription factor [Candidatus Methylopumilus planktonicus]QDD00258.1 response regulator transcription factor [Candidatus Methylopumilus planktonicus]QDD01581.1 response regulator transcription factor [Candidatus Methylopumilus planktonicus]QDD06877.1 response regulator transcription factor [Candidatus Methylopumilus planktonicus]QDD08213.1 response regulator transcription factor [Candidatus Methylopumilus planktonicus]QDD09540.1 response regulator transcription factor 
MSQIKILLVDDHAVVRMGFKMLIEAEDDITVIGEAESGEGAIKLFQELKPDIIVMDITMPGIGGIEAIDRIMAKDKNTKILVLSAHEDSVHPKRVLNAGAMGYLTKRSAAEELIKAIKSIHQGKRYLEPSIAQQMAITQLSGETNPIEILSDREFEVFIALAKGKSTNDIADTLCLSPRTVGTHLYNIKQKLNANNSAEIALIAIRCGLINP